MIDSHCHLYFKQFNGRRQETVRAANLAGVHTIVNIGVDLATSRQSIALAERFDGIYATVGVHPHDSKTLTDSALDELADLADHPRVCAIGEIGLDFYRDLSPRDIQRTVFRKQLKLAVDKKKPIVIHTREAMRPTIDIVREYAADLKGGVFHCFPGDAADAAEVISLGFVVAVGGTLTYPNSCMAAMASVTPLDKIILETDAPFLAPAPYRGKTNRPEYIPIIRDRLAELQGVSRQDVEKTTDRTCQKLFGLVEVFGD
ncbi:MAG: TatD family hydrolase [bacterium]